MTILEDLLSPHQRAQLDNLATAWGAASCVATERGVAVMQVYAEPPDDEGLHGPPVEIWRVDGAGMMTPQLVLGDAARRMLRLRGLHVPDRDEYA